MYVTGLLVAGNKLLRLGVAIHVEMTGNSEIKRGQRTKPRREGGVFGFEIMTSYIGCTATCTVSLTTVLCDTFMMCLKSNFLVLCSMMVENVSRGGSLRRYR